MLHRNKSFFFFFALISLLNFDLQYVKKMDELLLFLDLSSPKQGLNLGPWQGKHIALSTGLKENFPVSCSSFPFSLTDFRLLLSLI